MQQGLRADQHTSASSLFASRASRLAVSVCVVRSRAAPSGEGRKLSGDWQLLSQAKWQPSDDPTRSACDFVFTTGPDPGQGGGCGARSFHLLFVVFFFSLLCSGCATGVHAYKECASSRPSCKHGGGAALAVHKGVVCACTQASRRGALRAAVGRRRLTSRFRDVAPTYLSPRCCLTAYEQPGKPRLSLARSLLTSSREGGSWLFRRKIKRKKEE